MSPEELLRAGLIKTTQLPTKILGAGEIHHSLVVKANEFSSSAERKIVAAGGEVRKI